MNSGAFGKTILLTVFSAFMASCSGESDRQEAAVEKANPAAAPIVERRDEDEQVTMDSSAGLGGTAWQLVKISSMDDSTYEPDDGSRYTLNFGDDGAATMIIDCNRGTGSWASESDGQLQFGPIAATRAMCPPGSLHDRYLGQFEWVRSYVMKDGHLFLATMADGSIIEFEPMDAD